jgi:hypothetical protein
MFLRSFKNVTQYVTEFIQMLLRCVTHITQISYIGYPDLLKLLKYVSKVTENVTKDVTRETQILLR